MAGKRQGTELGNIKLLRGSRFSESRSLRKGVRNINRGRIRGAGVSSRPGDVVENFNAADNAQGAGPDNITGDHVFDAAAQVYESYGRFEEDCFG